MKNLELNENEKEILNLVNDYLKKLKLSKKLAVEAYVGMSLDSEEIESTLSVAIDFVEQEKKRYIDIFKKKYKVKEQKKVTKKITKTDSNIKLF